MATETENSSESLGQYEIEALRLMVEHGPLSVMDWLPDDWDSMREQCGPKLAARDSLKEKGFAFFTRETTKDAANGVVLNITQAGRDAYAEHTKSVIAGAL